jgi:SAM-dependent methyltransferase
MSAEDKLREAWRSSRIVFMKQLAYNKMELEKGWPKHWNSIVAFLGKIPRPVSMLDIACGCGALSQVVKLRCPDVAYAGADYSPEAISVAKEAWPGVPFEVKDYKELTKEYMSPFNVLHAGALTNILPDGDACLMHLLSLEVPHVLLTRILLDTKSWYSPCKAYDEVNTCRFCHGQEEFMDSLSMTKYVIVERDADDFLLGRKM